MAYEAPPPRQKRGTRSGFTTGACATAATKAALHALLTGERLDCVSIHLPADMDATFFPGEWQEQNGEVSCGIIKDAGDDPDVTHGAMIRVAVCRHEEPGVIFAAGEGVGTVTKPGLGLDIGAPAINAMPRQMMTDVVTDILGSDLSTQGVKVTVSIPDGERLAKKTLNGRLGIVGGLSILGTTGIVHAYSTAAWRASVVQAVDVAAAGGCQEIVLSTGGTTERFAMGVRQDLSELAFVEMGIFTGDALKTCVKAGVKRVTLSGQIGKFSKIAQGFMQTHAAGNRVDTEFLANLAAKFGVNPSLREAIRTANTGRHVGELVLAEGALSYLEGLCQEAVEQCCSHVQGQLEIGAFLFDFDGTLLVNLPPTG